MSMNPNALLKKIRSVRAVLLGDLCLDVYWSADMTKSKLSRETAHYPLPVVRERMSPGAGGNAASCMAALCPKELTVLGVIGKDWRGAELQEEFSKIPGLDASRIVVSGAVRTNAYCKPMRFGYSGEETEDPRLDFENYEPLPKDAEEALLAALSASVSGADVLVVSDQFAFGCVTGAVRDRVNALASDGLRVLVDSRSRIGLYRNALLKPNEIECARALGLSENALSEGASEAELSAAAAALSKATASDVCLTLGSRGSLFLNGEKSVRIPAVLQKPPVDIVGAGDCFLSALALALAAGAAEEEACSLASYASAVSVKKLGVTGTASPEEIRALWEERHADH